MPADVFRLKREQLVAFLEQSQAIRSREVREAFLAVPREAFFPVGAREQAYVDAAFPIGHGQTISQPSTLASMLELLQVRPGQKVLEVGSGCGYVLALLAHLVGAAGKVFGVELLEELAGQSKKNLAAMGCRNAESVQGDGSQGLPEHAPFDRILVSAACPFIPKPLFDQLADGGRVFGPVGDAHTQTLTSLHKKRGQLLKEEFSENYYVFVPLKGRHGFGGGMA
ncbi:MAG TPA: protein-L-isoaspartate O-methyltransferase [Candidatus Diapherotrites archaeon]|uniref:Protein-L-isoaspartate O-methyltransferase n=1 Tax=Candidatus Iainarchaeum sp. TaxID=3101447 RepID=A0A7J4JJP8_9ARCH|nr:protein-L-isoaspartate O-methyltransferase [Candidatus Diapherotrites archaeon]